MVSKINKKSGQIIKSNAPAGLAENVGATDTFNPRPQTFQIGNTLLSKADYDTAKGLMGMKSGKGGELTPAAVAAANQKTALQQQQETLQSQQSAELAAVGEEDFTQLGMPDKATQVLEGAAVTTDPNLTKSGMTNEQFLEQTPMDKLGGILSGSAIPQGTQAGIAPLLSAAPIAPIVTLKPLITKASNAVTSLKSLKLLGAGGFIYGLLTDKKSNDIEADINDMVTTAKLMASRINQGADPVEVRGQIEDMENAIRDKIGELNVANRYNLKNRIIGADTQDYSRKQITKMVMYRQAVENYIATGNPAALNAMIGTVEQ